MDTSFWIQCNPKIAIEHTTKKYFGKYLYRLVINCPAGRLIAEANDMATALEHRKSVAKSINHGGWWGSRNNKDIDNADLVLLEIMRNIRNSENLDGKMRIEEPSLQLYTYTEKTLIDLVKTHIPAQYLKHIKIISSPEDEEAEEILNNNGIIRRSDIGYRYKVTLRDCRMESAVKESLLNYLSNLGEETIRIPNGTIEMLMKPRGGYVWGMYFYANDVSVIPFINLISPGIVSNCHELHVLSNK